MINQTDTNRQADQGDTSERPACHERSLELAEAGDHEQDLACIQEYLATAPDDVEALNDTGTILHCLDRSEEAIEHLLRAKQLDTESPEIIWNLVETYLAAGKPTAAAELFDELERMGIFSVDILNRTANVFLEQDNKHDAIEMLLRSVDIVPNQEILGPMITVIRGSRPHIAFVCTPDQRASLSKISEFTNQRFDSCLFEGNTDSELFDLMKWSDISWIECGPDDSTTHNAQRTSSDLAIAASKQTRVCKNVLRVHSYAEQIDKLNQVNWANIDVLVIVDDDFDTDTLISRVPGIQGQTTIVNHTLPDQVDQANNIFLALETEIESLSSQEQNDSLQVSEIPTLATDDNATT